MSHLRGGLGPQARRRGDLKRNKLYLSELVPIKELREKTVGGLETACAVPRRRKECPPSLRRYASVSHVVPLLIKSSARATERRATDATL